MALRGERLEPPKWICILDRQDGDGDMYSLCIDDLYSVCIGDLYSVCIGDL